MLLYHVYQLGSVSWYRACYTKLIFSNQGGLIVLNFNLLLRMWFIRHVVYSSCDLFVMWFIRHVIHSSCGLFVLWFIRHVIYSSCDLFVMWFIRHVVYSACGLFVMWLNVYLNVKKISLMKSDSSPIQNIYFDLWNHYNLRSWATRIHSVIDHLGYTTVLQD